MIIAEQTLVLEALEVTRTEAIAAFKERLRQKVEGRIVQIQRCFDSAVAVRSPDQADYWLHELNVTKDFLKLLDETKS